MKPSDTAQGRGAPPCTKGRWTPWFTAWAIGGVFVSVGTSLALTHLATKGESVVIVLLGFLFVVGVIYASALGALLLTVRKINPLKECGEICKTRNTDAQAATCALSEGNAVSISLARIQAYLGNLGQHVEELGSQAFYTEFEGLPGLVVRVARKKALGIFEPCRTQIDLMRKRLIDLMPAIPELLRDAMPQLDELQHSLILFADCLEGKTADPKATNRRAAHRRLSVAAGHLEELVRHANKETTN